MLEMWIHYLLIMSYCIGCCVFSCGRMSNEPLYVSSTETGPPPNVGRLSTPLIYNELAINNALFFIYNELAINSSCLISIYSELAINSTKHFSVTMDWQ